MRNLTEIQIAYAFSAPRRLAIATALLCSAAVLIAFSCGFYVRGEWEFYAVLGLPTAALAIGCACGFLAGARSVMGIRLV